MPKPKIDKVKLYRMVRNGRSVKYCAEYFKVSPAAISMAKKNLNISVVKNVALENAHRVVDKNLNAIDQLQKINDYANELLDLLMKWQRGDTEALQVYESKLSTKKAGSGKNKAHIGGFKTKDPRELALKAMAEIRGQLKLQLEIFQCLYDMKAVQEFQNEVLTAIGDAAPDVRNRIIHNLNQKRAIRSAIEFS
jgi:hypothetical protein